MTTTPAQASTRLTGASAWPNVRLVGLMCCCWWVAHNQLLFAMSVYEKADPDYHGNITVPVLWDKKEETIVNNESSEVRHQLRRACGLASA